MELKECVFDSFNASDVLSVSHSRVQQLSRMRILIDFLPKSY